MIPEFQAVMRPVLELLADGQVRRSRDMYRQIADWFQLNEAERAVSIPSGRQRVIDNRVSWAITYLSRAGLVARPQRGHVQITPEGEQALLDHPEFINKAVLMRYESFREFQQRTKEPDTEQLPEVRASEVKTESTPIDLAERAVAANKAAVEVDVLEAALDLTPTAFEELVIRLLGAMGYGKSGMLERTSASGDAGVDGIISQDPLGLDRIYVQAKRYAADNPVDRPRIHEFAGALLGKQGDRGVFITTSKFTKGAREEAERINARIELIDGDRLAELLVNYQVGTQEELTVTLFRLDEDFFDTL